MNADAVNAHLIVYNDDEEESSGFRNFIWLRGGVLAETEINAL